MGNMMRSADQTWLGIRNGMLISRRGNSGSLLCCAGALIAKEVQKFALEGFPARSVRIDQSSLQAFLGLEPKVRKA